MNSIISAIFLCLGLIILTKGKFLLVEIEKAEGLIATDQREEVCDVKGYGIDDCVNQCCNPSICEITNNPEQNPDKRCCTKEERKQDPIPSDCTPCTVCCDEAERNLIPLPDHCSKCPKCEQPAPPTTYAPATTEGESAQRCMNNKDCPKGQWCIKKDIGHEGFCRNCRDEPKCNSGKVCDGPLGGCWVPRMDSYCQGNIAGYGDLGAAWTACKYDFNCDCVDWDSRFGDGLYWTNMGRPQDDHHIKSGKQSWELIRY